MTILYLKAGLTSGEIPGTTYSLYKHILRVHAKDPPYVLVIQIVYLHSGQKWPMPYEGTQSHKKSIFREDFVQRKLVNEILTPLPISFY